MQQLEIMETPRPEQIKRGHTVLLRSEYGNIPAKTRVRVVRTLQIKGEWFARVVCGLTSNAKNIMKTLPITALELEDEPRALTRSGSTTKEQKRQIVVEAKHTDLKELAMRYGITVPWLKRIIVEAELRAKEIAKLKGSETLPTRERNLLLRMRYQSVQEARRAIQNGSLHEGRTFGLGGKHFAKIVNWAFPEHDQKTAA